MPQLDYIIIFSQIFWLFIIFTMLYILLTHFFLPKFLKSLKSRKQITEINSKEVFKTMSKFKSKQTLLKQTLLNNLLLAKSSIATNIIFKDLNKDFLILQQIDKKISWTIFNLTTYCNNQSLEFLPFNFKSINLKFNL